MQKQFLVIIRICKIIFRYSIYILVFLLPILFLPWTSDALDFNKQAILVLFVFLALFAWMARVLVSGKLSLNPNKTHIFAAVLFLAVLLSTVFSLDKYGSFWGWPRVTSESLITLMSLAVFYFLVSNVLSKKDIFISITLLGLSGFFVCALAVLQFFGFFLPFNFAKSAAFNTIGMVGALGLFTATLLPLLIILEMYSGKKLKIVFGAGIALSAAVLVLINYPFVWWAVLAGCATLILFGVVKKELFDLRWLGLPIFFLALALFFIIVNIQIPAPQRPLEVYLNQSTSADIALKTIKNRPILGSGPGTFSYDFSKYKSSDLNKGILWSIKFNSAGSKALTVLATTGIFGFASFLALIASVFFYGAKLVLSRNLESDRHKIHFSVFALGALAAFASQTLAFFIYGSNLTLDFLFFFLAAIFIGLTAEKKKEFLLNPSSLLTLGATFVATVIFIFGLGLLVLAGQRYAAEIYYVKGASVFASGQKDKGIQNLENAVKLNPKSDIYLIRLSEAYLLQLESIINDSNLSDAEKSEISQFLVNNSINAAKLATDASPQNANNWSARGFVYQNLIGTVLGADDWALNSYSQAVNLEPTNPHYPTQRGIVYYQSKDFNSAKINLESAIFLSPNYANALYFLGLTYYNLNQTDKALEQFEKISALNPGNEHIGLILDNLNSGKNPLFGIREQENPPQAPVEEFSVPTTNNSTR